MLEIVLKEYRIWQLEMYLCLKHQFSKQLAEMFLHDTNQKKVQYVDALVLHSIEKDII